MSDDMTADGLSNAGISPRERLQRIEELLSRVDSKLDNKANAGDLVALELRVRSLEQHGGERVSEMREKVAVIDADLQSIGRKLATATATLASVVVLVNAATIYFINH